MKISLLCIVPFLFISISLKAQQPAINSFSPVSGYAGSNVTIIGTNFSSIKTNNIVFFGGVRAKVLNATVSSLTVEVPIAAANAPIMVEVNNLITVSSQKFTPIFNDGSISKQSFDTVQFSSQFGPTNDDGVKNADIDGDGRLDLIVRYGEGIAIFRNIGVGENYTFDTSQSIYETALNGGCDFGLFIEDMDADGLKDIIYRVGCVDSFLIFKNKSVKGQISFDPGVSIPMVNPGNWAPFIITDFDMDGKADFIGLNPNNNPKASVYRNTTTVNSFSFASPVSVSAGYIPPFFTDPRLMTAADFDGDNRPDLAITQFNSGYVLVIKNISTPGSINFGNTVSPVTDLGAYWLADADVDSDGKTDIVVVSSDFGYRTISVLRNISSVGTISFAPRIFYQELNTGPIEIADMDGDSKADFVIKNHDQGDSIFIKKNNSSPGSINFSDKIIYPLQGRSLSVGDFNNDSLPDIAVSNRKLEIFKHLRSSALITEGVMCSPVGNTTLSSNIIGLFYQWQVDDGSGFIDISNNANYSGATSDQLHLINIPSSWYGYKYRCFASNSYSEIKQLRFIDRWVGAINSNWENPGNWSCGSVPDANTDVIIDNGSVLVNSNITVRSLNVNSSATITVSAGKILNVLH